jgi:hypothetical protein
MHYKFFIIISIIFIVLYLIIMGYNENSKNYEQDYQKTVGTIIMRKIESNDFVQINKKTNIYEHKKQFRLKLFYKYKVNDVEYNGYFYNDGNNDNFLNSDEYIPIGNQYRRVHFINVYYNKQKLHDNYIKLDHINIKKKKLYYYLCFIFLFTLPIIIFI